MKSAIQNAVYFTNTTCDTHLIYTYSDKDGFTDIIKSFRNNIDITMFFEDKDSIIYSILDKLPNLYEKLYLDQINSVYLINKKGICIELRRNVENNVENTIRNAFIRTESVLTEYYKNTWNGILYPTVFLLGVLSGMLSLEFIKRY